MDRTCCFFGHRKINATLELREKVYSVIEKLIIEDKISVFLFGSKSESNPTVRQAKSGTEIAYKYAIRKGKAIINVSKPFNSTD